MSFFIFYLLYISGGDNQSLKAESIDQSFSSNNSDQLSDSMMGSFSMSGLPSTSGAGAGHWEEVKAPVVNGILQPMVFPPSTKPRRNTNQLQYILKIINKNLWKHQFAWPFHHPVDAVKLGIPDYHDIIERPMDMGTIKKRIENFWYYSAQECIADFRLMFNNCYKYNKDGEDVVYMARTLEGVLDSKLKQMPPDEVELIMPVKGAKGKGKGKSKGYRGMNTIIIYTVVMQYLCLILN